MTWTIGLSRSRAASVQQYSIVVMLLLVMIVFASVSKPFFTVSNLSNVLLQASATAIAAVGMTFVILIGEIDISIGSLMSLAMTVAWMVAVAPTSAAGEQAAVSAWVYPVGLAMGLILGLINGLLINILRINSFIATLATMFAFRGIAWKMVGSSDKPFADSAVLFLGRTEFLGVGLPVYLVIVMAMITLVVLTGTPFGRYTRSAVRSARQWRPGCQ